MSAEINCPKCGTPCDRDEVDIGVGVICSPWRCNGCGWQDSVCTLANMKMDPCISCGSYEIDPATGLCDECAEDMGIDDDYEDYDDDN